MSLTLKTAKSIKWLTSAGMAERVIQTGTTVVLARILGPSDFGLFAMAFVAMRGLNFLRSFGFDTALIRYKGDMDKAAATAFCITPIMGIVIFLGLYLCAPFLASFFNNDKLTAIIRVLGVMFVLTSISRVSGAIMERKMLFRQLSIIDVLTSVIFTSFAIPLALAGFGVMSLIYAYVLKILFRTIMVIVMAGWKPRFAFDKQIAVEMFHFGKYRLAESLVEYFSRNTDNIIIGKFMGAVSLGYYNIAYNFSHLLGRYFMSGVNKVLYPAFNQVKDDNSNYRRIYLKSLLFLALLSIPFATIIYFFSDDIINIIYGPKWLPAIPILKILVLASTAGIIGSSIAPILLSKGRSGQAFYLTVVYTVVLVVVMIPLIIVFKLKGAASAYLIANFARTVVGWRFLEDCIELRFSRIVEQFKLPLLASSGMALIAFVVQTGASFFPLSGFVNVISFCLQFAVTGISFLGAMYLFDRPVVFEIKRILLSKM